MTLNDLGERHDRRRVLTLR